MFPKVLLLRFRELIIKMPNYRPGGYSSDGSDYSDTEMFITQMGSLKETKAPSTKESCNIYRHGNLERVKEINN
jgi:hypothetical protein